jgi:membrane fusion protein (multidrug efflux system)
MMRNSICGVATSLCVLALFALASGCKKSEAQPSAAPTVQVVEVAQQDVPIYREWVGSTAADVNANINAQVTGYLLKRGYEEGKLVKKGDLLFQIDDRTYKAAYDRAAARVTKTDEDVQRYTPLAKKQAISQQELDDAIQDNLAARAAAEQARLDYEFCKITAPVDGIAGLARAQTGDLVGPNSGPLTTVTTIDPMRVYFSVSQRFMTEYQEARLAEGKPLRSEDEGPDLELILSTGSAYPHRGKVKYANNQIDVATGTVRLAGEFPNPDSLLVAGMFVRVKAQMGVEKNALLVPQKAVTEMQGRYLVAAVGSDHKVSIKPVQPGEWFGDKWVIKGELKAGDLVVAEGVQKVRDGADVNPVPAGKSAGAK